MKVGFLIDHFCPQRGGAERYLADLASFLSRKGFHVHLYCISGSGQEPPLTLHRVPCIKWMRWLKEWSFARRSLAMARANGMDLTVGIRHIPGVDLYHPHGGVYRVAFRQGLFSVESPLLRTLRLLFRFLSLRQWFFLVQEWRIYCRKPRPLVAAVSRGVKEDIVRHYRFPEKNIRVIYNGVDGERFHPFNRKRYRTALRAELGIPEEALVLLFVAHNFRLKGLACLIRALACCKAGTSRPLILLVVGRGRRRAYERLARSLGVEREVRFTGEVSHVERYYGASDVFVLPTFHDPCSLVVLEALACGLPVITTRCNGAAEILTEGKEGLILNHPSDVAELAKGILRLLDEKQRAAMGRAAGLLNQKISYERNFGEMFSLMTEAVKRKKN